MPNFLVSQSVGYLSFEGCCSLLAQWPAAAARVCAVDYRGIPAVLHRQVSLALAKTEAGSPVPMHCLVVRCLSRSGMPGGDLVGNDGVSRSSRRRRI
jgi:hypothetical protein